MTDPAWENLRADFPVFQKWAYFAWASVAPLPRQAVDAMRAHLESLQAEGVTCYKEWYQCYQDAREHAAALAGGTLNEYAFVKNTSEGISLVAEGFPWQVGDRILLPEGEFPANVYPWKRLSERGVELDLIPLRPWGGFTLEDALERMTPRTRLFSVSFVNYWSGFRAPIAELGRACRERGVFFFVDAIQGLGAHPFVVERMQVDAFAADGHKWLCAPEGHGIFYLRPGLPFDLRPLSTGWWNQRIPGRYEDGDQALAESARRFECGTLPTTNCYGLRAALARILEVGVERIHARIMELTGQLRRGLAERGAELLGRDQAAEWSGIVAFRPAGWDVREFERHALSKGITLNARAGWVRASVHAWNDASDLERLLEAAKAS